MEASPMRRRLLQAVTGLLVLPPLGIGVAPAATGRRPASPTPFSFRALRERARRLARQPHRPAEPEHPDLLRRIDYDTYQRIRFRHENALWRGESGIMPVEFFHLGRYANRPVAVYALEDGMARRIRYTSELFEYGDVELAEALPDDLGFAGFRVMDRAETRRDWLAFMGASYFRSAGELDQYGLSARGIAVNTASLGHPEEFPRFTAFWLERPPSGSDALTIYALLEGESITGAYRFDCRKETAVITDVHAELFQRADIAQLGIAPLTSMYWYSETNRRRGTDWRPEIHDSDGLALWTGAGERIWRPLNAPPHVQSNSFLDRNPRGFGLLQRDRAFDHYQDDGVFYDRRPSVWVEPRGDWGSGAVHLLEMPTEDEIHDNIAAFWVPERPATEGTAWNLDYRLHWVAAEPYPPSLAHVVATRVGRAGVPGQHAERDPAGRKFAIDFTGGPLADLEQRYDLEVVTETSRGSVDNPYALKVVGTDRWRAVFDLYADGTEVVDLRCYLRLGDRTLTETWVYQYFPGSLGLPLGQA